MLFSTKQVLSLFIPRGGITLKEKEIPPGHKKCSRCGEVKPINEFYKRSSSKDGLAYACKDCEKSGVNKSYKKTKDKKKQKQRYQANREKILEQSRQYYQKNKEARRAYHKEYQKNNPQVRKKADAKRRELLKKAREGVEPYTRYDVIDRDSIDGIPICQLCNKSLKLEEVEIDHIIPLAKGGKDELSNVRVLCSLCNASRPRDGRDLC